MAVVDSQAFLDGSYGVTPLIAVAALDVASTGEPHEARVQRCQLLGQVTAHTVLAALERRRHQAHAIQINGSGLAATNGEPSELVAACGRDLGGVLLPLSSLADVHRGVSKVGTLITLERQRDIARPVVGRPYPEGGTVGLTADDVDTPETDVARAVARLGEVEMHGTFLCGAEQVLRRDAEGGVANGPPVVGISTILFHGTIADELGIEPAVARMVDLLVEDAIVQRTDDGTTLRGGEIERGLRRCREQEERRTKQD